MNKFLSVGALAVLASCAYSTRQYDNFTDWSGRQFDSAGNAVSSGVDDVTPSKKDFTLKDHYQGYPYDNTKEMTDGKTMKAVVPQNYNPTPDAVIVDPKTGTPELPGQGIENR